MKIHTKTAISTVAMLMLACVTGQSMAQNTEFRYQQVDEHTVKVGFWNNAYYTKDRAQQLVFEKIATLALNQGNGYFELMQPQVSTDYVAAATQDGKQADGEVVKTMVSPSKRKRRWQDPGVIVFPRYFFTTQVKFYERPPHNAMRKVYNAKMVVTRYQQLETPFASVNRNNNATSQSGQGQDDAMKNAMANDGSVTQVGHTENLSPKVVEWTNKSYQHLQKEEYVEAIRTASAAINLNKNFDMPYVNRATAYIKHGYQDKAFSDVDTALALNPDNALAINMKGYLSQQRGATDAALQYYSKACSEKLELGCSNFKELAGFRPDNVKEEANFYLNKSKMALEKNRWKEAIEWSTKAINADPSNYKAYANRAGALAEAGRPKEALLDADQAIALNPDFGPAYHNRGHAYKIMGDQRDAALEFEIACKLGVDESCTEFKNVNSVAKSE
ncbi:MAG: hypothetical protein PVJ39_13555 [Gammaproteobacteria bacterium]